MTATATAIYENGVLRPLSPLPLPEGTQVEVTVTDRAPSNSAYRPEAAIAAMDEIAALPLEGAKDPFSGQDHDRVLYGA